ncbi:uncharacterized protein EDB91DRAFT_1086094 [Suillus paluster]|uniref:uncharacterized protein n=1 Tax=Suillus paluster TaxID=48578 RepID=UPI001B874372|nr:uncharacterized protein EDB91DRAFT_1086094 [Suillus paluster]KAG1728359.1 hypothetical protein EDB91DRAFT_1086094 [Suillus paluster]
MAHGVAAGGRSRTYWVILKWQVSTLEPLGHPGSYLPVLAEVRIGDRLTSDLVRCIANPEQSSFDSLKLQWQNPSGVISVLSIIGGDVVQHAISQAAQLPGSGPSYFNPVSFSFGWVAYFSAPWKGPASLRPSTSLRNNGGGVVISKTALLFVAVVGKLEENSQSFEDCHVLAARKNVDFIISPGSVSHRYIYGLVDLTAVEQKQEFPDLGHPLLLMSSPPPPCTDTRRTSNASPQPLAGYIR